jgi:hypothetical protein
MKTENLTPGSWVHIMFESKEHAFKAHYCPSVLAAALLADAASRNSAASEVKETAEGWIELPGMCMVDRPIEEIETGGFRLCIPTQDFAHFGARLMDAPVRKFADGKEYHKIHGWHSCIVFTPEQREEVLAKMDGMLDAVQKRAEEADEEFSRRMAQINKDGPRVISARDKNSPYVKRVPEPAKDNN